MNTLSEHQKHPIHFQRPWIFTFANRQGEWEFFFEINSQQIIEAFYYLGPDQSPWIGYFSALAQLLPQQTVEAALCFSWAEFLPLFPTDDLVSLRLPWQNGAIVMIQNALKNYLGIDQLIVPCKDTLICRCLGVTKEEIIATITAGANTVMAITGKLKAAGACTNCVVDLENLLREYTPSPRTNWAQMIVDIDEWGPELLAQLTGVECQLEVLRLGPGGLDLTVHSILPPVVPLVINEKQQNSLRRAIKKQYPIISQINFT